MSTLPERSELLALVNEHTCQRNCFGIAGYAASCCKLEERDFIQGPIPDAAEFLEAASRVLGEPLEYGDVFIDFDEGRQLFPERSSWQAEANFPALRPRATKDLRCKFLDDDDRCSVYEARPAMCREFRCEHLSTLLDLL